MTTSNKTSTKIRYKLSPRCLKENIKHNQGELVYQRQLKVSNNGYTRRKPRAFDQGIRSQEAIPIIKLRGLWLKEAGFNVNATVQVKIMEECIVLSIIRPSK